MRAVKKCGVGKDKNVCLNKEVNSERNWEKYLPCEVQKRKKTAMNYGANIPIPILLILLPNNKSSFHSAL